MNRLGVFLSAALVFGAFLVGQGCKSTTGLTEDENVIKCTPGNFVFCKCADSARGTKLCREDGHSFEPCTNRSNGQCKEIKDANTNKPVDGNGDPVITPDDDDDTTDDDDTKPDDGPTDLDQCPGKTVSVAPGREILLQNDTSKALGDRRGKVGGACASADGTRDFIYALKTEAKGSLEVKVKSEGALDPIVYIRTVCDDETTQAACGPQSGTKTATTKLPVLTGTTYYLFVDGASGGTGAFTATVNLTAGNFCSDGSVDSGEVCDDTNHSDGDGCSAGCNGIGGNPTTAGACPGQSVDLWKGLQGNKGSTASGVAGFKAVGGGAVYGSSLNTPNKDTCASLPASGTNTGKDHIYKVTPHSAGTLNITLEPDAAGGTLDPALFLSAHDDCTATAPTVACATVASNKSSMQINVDANKTVFIAVDGASTGDETYKITFKLN